MGQVVICTSCVQKRRGLLKGERKLSSAEKTARQAKTLIGSQAVSMVAGRSPHLRQMVYNL